MAAFGFALHPERAPGLAHDAVEWLLQRGHEVRLQIDEATALGRADLGVADAEFAIELDLMVSLGGDGTMLRAVELVAGEGVAVLGVNLGQLGYLTEVEPDGMRMAFKRFLAGSYVIEERMRLEAEVHRAAEAEPATFTALNEVVIEKALPGRTVRLDVELDGRPFTSYVADGLILATPTGSTAYSFSVRGPIVDPRHRAVVLTPAAAHMLFDRSLVLGPDCEISVSVGGDRDASVCVDGQTVGALVAGDRVVCTASGRPARIVTFGTRDFHSVLRSKFGLSAR